MNVGKPSRFGTNLMVTFVFALAALLIINFFPIGENIIINGVIGIGSWILFPTIAGLVAKDNELTYYVSSIVGVVAGSTSLFPFRYVNITWFIGLPMIGGLIGGFFGFFSEAICSRVQSYVKGDRQISLQITRKRLLLTSLSLVSILLIFVIYIHLESVIVYFDQHTWVVPLIGIIASNIVTAIFAFFGWKYYERRKRDEE